MLGLACVAAIAGAFLAVGPAASAPQSTRRVITVEKGVVQSTVSASGSLQPARQLNVNFKAAGTLLALDVRAGQHVYQGQLLAELDPQAANVALQQAQAGLQSAQAGLAQAQSTPATSAPAVSTTPSSSAAAARTTGAAPKTSTTTTTPAAAKPAAAATTVSPATRAANIASAQAAVASAELGVKSAQVAVESTRLYAPASGTIASLADTQPGATVAAGTTGAATSAAASTATTGGGGGGATNSSSSAASAAFIVLVDLSGMDLIVPLSEADVPKVRAGQAAAVTVNALPGSDLAAHVTSVATLPTTTGGVVSYNVTLHLDQLQFGLRPGMTAAAAIVVSRAQGAVSLPSSAISRAGGQSTVTVVNGGKDVVQPIVTGIVGDSATQVVAGLSGGEQVAIVTATNLGSSAAASGGLGARALGGAALGGGGGGGFGGGGAGGGAGGRRGGG